jgi:hypothetical protein
MRANWRTTAGGLALALGAVLNAVGQFLDGGLPAVDAVSLVSALGGALGLIAAADMKAVTNAMPPHPGPGLDDRLRDAIGPRRN